ncbi:MAG: porphobilinogen synthase [Myxococcaceae bacterium]|nr:MAG: porphobilinogen synthase [Myxococcaceae bacterium]
MAYPIHRPRRLRRTEALRRMVRETELRPSDFIYPLFVVEGRGVRTPVPSMPGIDNLSVDLAVEEAKRARAVGVPSVILFGIPGHKDPRGSGAWAEDGIVQKALRALKDSVPELQLIADICLCEYTDHGHCGVIHGGEVDNDQSLPLLAQMAVSCARAGADIVAPSDMMDGRVAAIRTALDGAALSRTPILSYAAKYASGFYGPFREAAQSTPQFGDRRGYQMDPGNVREALKEVALDLEEGADLVMVKPALSYLDVIARVKERFDVPVAAYNVSGEYAMVKAAAANGWIDGQRVMMEVLTSIKRAGADLILTYHAVEAAELLNS